VQRPCHGLANAAKIIRSSSGPPVIVQILLPPDRIARTGDASVAAMRQIYGSYIYGL